MVVQHNMQALNANRMLGITTGSQAKSAEKLSSGYRINRAADDAAGLSISEKMRKQIRGLDRASANAQDGISCVQTAEGALTEVTSMLQRMNELAVQSANGTNSEDDRTAIQNEIDQLADEIDRVSETTKFNETYLLKGTGDAKTSTVESGVKSTTRAGIETPFEMAEATGNSYKGKITSTLGKGTEDTVTVSYTDKLGDSYTREVKFTVGADASETAANIAAAINSDDVLKDFTATAQKDGTLSIESNANYYELQELNAGTNAYQITGLEFGSAEKDPAGTDNEAKLQTSIDITGAGQGNATGNTYTLDITELKAGDTVTIDGTTYTFDPDKAHDNNKTHSFSTAQELLDRLGDDYNVSASLTFDTVVTTGTMEPLANNTDYTVNTATSAGTTSVAAINSALVTSKQSGQTTVTFGNSAVRATSATASADIAANVGSSVSVAAAPNMKIALKITKKTAPEETKTTTSREALSLNFHVGADSSTENKINVKIDSMDASTLGIRDGAGKALDLSTEEGATAAIDTISEALKKVSAQRSSLGAIQNRLEHTIANLDNVVENTTSAESAIRDTDMASEMVEYSKNNILAQAGQSMLAQANQSTQGVLSLLG